MQVSERRSISSPSLSERIALCFSQTLLPYMAASIRDRGRRLQNQSNADVDFGEEEDELHKCPLCFFLSGILQ